MILILAVVAGVLLTLWWSWAFRDARTEYFKAQIAAANADRARAEQALDRAVASGQVKRGAPRKG